MLFSVIFRCQMTTETIRLSANQLRQHQKIQRIWFFANRFSMAFSNYCRFQGDHYTNTYCTFFPLKIGIRLHWKVLKTGRSSLGWLLFYHYQLLFVIYVISLFTIVNYWFFAKTFLLLSITLCDVCYDPFNIINYYGFYH